MKLGSCPAKQKAGAEPERKALALAPLGRQPGRLRGQVGVEDGMYTCSISVGSRKARKLESLKILKL